MKWFCDIRVITLLKLGLRLISFIFLSIFNSNMELLYFELSITFNMPRYPILQSLKFILLTRDQSPLRASDILMAPVSPMKLPLQLSSRRFELTKMSLIACEPLAVMSLSAMLRTCRALCELGSLNARDINLTPSFPIELPWRFKNVRN
jgi:hypothetical protein